MVLLSLGAFLPADLIGRPGWRDELEALGVETGKLNVIQWQIALEYHAVYFFLAFAALWILGLRFSARATGACTAAVGRYQRRRGHGRRAAGRDPG